ncbi:MAG TPA: hypothetical protein VF665_07220 [Longimicrobium sp.]|jgi:hypothetical protein|uniref:hypothetical protein n=1 Tax=Longimicrobium sp. TaxID=2029185 RepID=UPI002ED78247
MKIHYEVPSIGKEANGWAQQGPTCWYYATKMLLKFHKAVDPAAQGFYENLKALKIFKQFFVETERGAESQKAMQARQLQYDLLQGRMRNFDRVKLQIHERSQGKLAELEEAAAPPGPSSSPGQIDALRQEVAQLAAEVRDFRKDGQESQRLGRFLHVMTTVSGPTGGGDWNLRITRAFFPHEFFYDIPYRVGLGSPQGAYDCLAQWGPLLITGYVASPRPTHAEIYHQVTSFDSRGRHVVVLTGVDTDTGIAEFKDPNFSDRVCWCPYEDLILQNDGVSMSADRQASPFTAVRCSPQSNCSHLQSGRRPNYPELRRAPDEAAHAEMAATAEQSALFALSDD